MYENVRDVQWLYSLLSIYAIKTYAYILTSLIIMI